METPFVINPKAARFDLVWELHGHLDELRGMLNAMGIAVHTDGILESSVLAADRQVRQIQVLVDVGDRACRQRIAYEPLAEDFEVFGDIRRELDHLACIIGQGR